MSCKKNLIGQRFGRLTVVEELPERKCGHVVWLCKCDCGNYTKVTTSNLRSGCILSCRCYSKELTKEIHTTHGGRKTKLFGVWSVMRQRCNNANSKSYHNYGLRGIKVCDEWQNDFSAFQKWALYNGYEEGLTIDRINNDGNYEPSNCRWVSRKVQGNNTRRNILITIGDERKTLKQWCEYYNLDYNSTKRKVNLGVPVKEVMCISDNVPVIITFPQKI